MSEWNDHARWWFDEVRDDPIYRLDVIPLFDRLMENSSGLVLDLGCGEGQVLRHHRGNVVGCDVAMDLLRRARVDAPVVRTDLRDLSWIRTASVDGAYLVLVIEHLPDLDLLAEATRIVRPGGSLVLVMNHPAFTADGAGPIIDPTDGEFLWRWGSYFEAAECRMLGSGAEVTFYHRPLADILNTASDAGWMLEELIEAGFSEEAVAAQPGYLGQEQMPRLLGVRWMNTQGGCR
ncbi:MAG: class I SAM-dependent methyltransferase [bacterium]|nr:class I SAM-dependent methyltransferase [bacterium]